MNPANVDTPESRRQQLGQIGVATSATEFMASMYGSLPRTLPLLDAAAGALIAAFENRRTKQNFLSQITWDSDAVIAEVLDQMIHFDVEHFRGRHPGLLRNKP